MPALDANRNGSRAGVKKARKPKVKSYQLPPGPRGDAPQTRAQDFKRANTYKRTPAYKGAIKAAYKSGTVAQRQAQVNRIQSKPVAKRTVEEKAVLDTHRKRAARDRTAMSSQIMNDRQRAIIDRYKRTPSYTQALAASKREREAADKKAASTIDYIHETDPAKLKAAGFHKAGMVDKLMEAPIGALVSGAAVADAAYHDPLGVPSKTAKQLANALPAIPGGIYDLVTHPAKTLKEQAGQFAERSSQPFDQRVKAIRKHGGLEYAGDAAALLGGSSRAAGLGLRLTKDSARVLRPGVRVSGGVVRVPKERGAISDALGRGLQVRRAAAHEKHLAKAEAGGKPVDALEYQAAKANREAGHVVETVARRAGAKQTRLVAKQRSRGIYGFKVDQQHRVGVARKEINRLNPKEKKAFYYAATLGIRTPEHARALLDGPDGLAAKIRAAREAEGVKVTGRLKKADMLPDIEAILKAPHEYFTKKLGDTVEALRPDSERAALEDPSLTPEQIRTRIHAPLQHVLGMERGAVPEGRTLYHGSPVGPDVIGKEGIRTGTPNDLVTGPSERGAYFTPDVREARGYGRHLYAVDENALRNAVPDPELPHAVLSTHDVPAGDLKYLGEAGIHNPLTGQWDDKLVNEIAAAAEKRVPGHRYIDEHHLAFIDRVAAKAEQMGLAKPLYFKSERYAEQPAYATYALGGKTAMSADLRHKGVNLRHGLQDTSPAQYLNGLGRNIKRKHNWNLVADILDQNAVKEFSHPDGSTVSAIREQMAQAGVDPQSVALWNPRVYRKLAGDTTLHDAVDERFVNAEEYQQPQVAAALEHSVIKPGTPITHELAQSSGWHVVPAAVLKELEAQMVPSGKAGRAWDIAKGKASRALLLTGNIPWAGFQVASNAAMAAAATGGRALNPANWLGAARWWHELDPEARARVGQYIGLDATTADSHQIRLGATTNWDLVNAYRAFKAHPAFHTGIIHGRGPSVSQLNPLELMAAFDRKQNNAFRILAGYSLAKRDTVRRMGEAMGRADAAQAKLTSIMAKPPAEQLRALTENPHIMEDHADAINDWMGDYTTMTAHERKIINRLAMFYPYLRYSLRLMFYTLPVKHPAMTALLGELGQMRADELKKLFGKNGLPWNLGKIYFGSDGHVKSIDLRRANPALNSLMDAATNRNPAQLVGVAPPWAGWLFDQLYQKSSFTGKDWSVDGHAPAYGGPHLPLLSPERGKILADQILGLTFPYREAEKLTQRGPQATDSTLWSEDRIHYKGTDSYSQLQRKFGERRTNFQQSHESLIHDLIPLLPQADRGPAQAREDRILKRAEPKPGGKRKSTPHYFGGGSSGTHYFGATP